MENSSTQALVDMLIIENEMCIHCIIIIWLVRYSSSFYFRLRIFYYIYYWLRKLQQQLWISSALKSSSEKWRWLLWRRRHFLTAAKLEQTSRCHPNLSSFFPHFHADKPGQSSGHRIWRNWPWNHILQQYIFVSIQKGGKNATWELELLLILLFVFYTKTCCSLAHILCLESFSLGLSRLRYWYRVELASLQTR